MLVIDVAPTARRLQDRQRHQGTGKDETVGGNVCVLTKHIPTGHFMPIVLSPAVSFQSAVGTRELGWCSRSRSAHPSEEQGDDAMELRSCAESLHPLDASMPRQRNRSLRTDDDASVPRGKDDSARKEKRDRR